jgi:MoaA/NifB/PqqE/SkfB family radical SAM enzyme
MFYSESIKAVHIELTDNCNVSCPQCGRNKLGGSDNQHLPKKEISLEDFKRIFKKDFILNLNRIYACGNFGDPVVAKDTLEIFEYLRETNPEIRLGMNTNGSARDRKWWSRMGEIFSNLGEIKFGIDGLEDTNHIYRKGANFEKVIENAAAFIEAGGKAQWEYIVFKHNEHEVEKAKELSEKMGFDKFTLKKTGRFFSNTKVKTNEFQQVLRKDGTLDYIIEKPTLEKYQNKSLQKELDIINQFGSMDNYLDQTDIDCKVMKERSVYVSSEGLVFPCCWTANQLYLWYMPEKSGQVWNLLSKNGGKEILSAYQHDIDEIIKGPFFNSLKELWSCNSVKSGKPKVCAKTCGTLFDQFRDQYK